MLGKPLLSGLLALGLVLPSEAEAQNRTVIKGPIVFKDLSGDPIPSPYEHYVIDGLLAAETLDFQSGLPSGVPPDVEVTKGDHELFPFIYQVNLDRDGLWLQFDFNLGGFETQKRINIFEHRGTLQDRELVIQRRYENRASRIRAVQQGLETQTLLENDISQTLRLIEGLINDPVSEGSNTQAEANERYNDYMRAVVLMERVMLQGKPLSAQVSLRISTLQRRSAFDILSPENQFEIIAGLAYWFARSPTPNQQIQSTLTHGGMARTFFNDAYQLALDTNADTPINTTSLARSLQESYKFECPNEEEVKAGNANWSETCFFALYDAGEFDRRFAPTFYRTVLSAFATHLENSSRPETDWKTECGFRKKIVLERGDRVLFWQLYGELADIASAKQRRIALELSGNRKFKDMTYITQTLDRARDITALVGNDKQMVTETCASESVEIDTGG